MEKVTASYIVRFFPRALSELERKALNHYMHTSKLDGNISQQILGATPRGGRMICMMEMTIITPLEAMKRRSSFQKETLGPKNR